MIYLEQAGVCVDTPSDFHVLISRDISDIFDYLNFQHQVAHRKYNASGCHDDFANFVGSCPYLVYYCLWLNHVPYLHHHAIPTLLYNVMRAVYSWYWSHRTKVWALQTSVADVRNFNIYKSHKFTVWIKQSLCLLTVDTLQQYTFCKSRYDPPASQHSQIATVIIAWTVWQVQMC